MSVTVTMKVVYQLARATGRRIYSTIYIYIYVYIYIYTYIKPIDWFSRSRNSDTEESIRGKRKDL